MKYSIIIPTYKHFEDCLKPCVESLLQHTDFQQDIELIVVANGCEHDGTVEYIRNLRNTIGNNISIVDVDRACGYTHAINIGIKVSKGEYIVLLNNDLTIMGSNWLDMLVAPFLLDESVGITGAAKDYHKETEGEFLLFFCAMLKRDIMDRVGGIDSIFNPGYGEDIDYCHKLRRLGYKIVQVPNDISLIDVRPLDSHILQFPIWHKGSVTVKEVPEWSEVVPRNEKILLERYGKKVSHVHLGNLFDTLKREDITPWIDRITPHVAEDGIITATLNKKTNVTITKAGYIHNLFVGRNELAAIKKVDTIVDVSSPQAVKEFVLSAGSKNIEIFGGVWEGGYCMQQDPDEISNLLYDLKDMEVDEYLEIGSADGGVTRLVCDILKVHNVTTLDLGWADMNYPLNYRTNIINTNCSGNINIFRGDSRSKQADDYLSGRKYKLIFIDGDHSYEGAYADNQLAKKHAAPGAIIFYHDHLYIKDITDLCEDLKKDPELEFVKSYEGSKETQKGICAFRYVPNPIGEKTSIIIPTFNHLDDCLVPCIKSIIKTIDLTNTEVIIVANGCTDNTREFLEGLGKPFRYIWIDEQVGFIKATNAGIRAAMGDYIVLLNNDTEVLKSDWLDILKKPFSDPTVGITGPYKDWRFYWDNDVITFREEYIVFYCAMFRRSLVDKIGLLDEDFGMGYEEDIDYCVRAKKAGYKLVQVPNNIEDNLSITKEYLTDNPNNGWKQFPLLHKDKGTFTATPPLEWLPKKTSLLRKYPTKPRISVIIPSYNNLDLLKGCIHSIQRYTDLTEFEVIIVANGCTDETREFVHNLGAPFKLLWIDDKVGYIKATNAGIKQSMGDFIVLLNNDTELRPQEQDEWIKLLLTRFVDNVGIVGPRKAWRDDIKAEYLLFWCVMIKREVFQKIGLLDENFGEGYHEDVDFCIRAQRAGYKLVETPEDITYSQENHGDATRTGTFPIMHVGGGTFAQLYGNSLERLQKHLPHLYKKYDIKRVIDCCTFHNELDILEMRMEELDSVVDKFVVVESTLTHQGDPKPLTFESHRDRFSKFLHKIHYIVVEFPSKLTTWGRENFQRDAIMQGLQDCSDNDIIIISDCDEIVKKEVVQSYSPEENGVAAIEMDLYYYTKELKADKKWYKARMLPYSILREHSPQYFRGEGDYSYNTIIPNGGWHYSFYGNADQIREKLSSYGHEEFNNDNFNNLKHIQNCIDTGKDLFGRDITFTKQTPERNYKVYDCFSFFNELDILEIRLNELDPYVDYFVISEMNQTHSGLSKPLYFQENKERFSKWMHKIIHLIPSNIHTEDPWVREHYQRDYMMHALGKCKEQDLIIVSDLDEIPRGSTIQQVINPVYFELNQFSYYLNYNIGLATLEPGTYSRMCSYGFLKNKKLSLTGLRYYEMTENDKIGSGWHFSWMGGPSRIIKKLESWAHQELKPDKDITTIRSLIADGKEHWGRENGLTTKKWQIDSSFPQFVQENMDYLVDKNLLDIEKVAIVMPYYNDSMLLKSVSAIMGQTFLNWHLYIVDDGSDSDKRAVNILANHPKISIFEQDGNYGPSSARNRALNETLRDPHITHIAFCDSDDVWDSEYLMKQLQIIGNKDIVYSSVRHIFDNGQEAIPWGIPDPLEYPGGDVMIETPFIFISSVVCKKWCFSNKRFDNSLDSIEDWDMWLRFDKEGHSFIHNPEKLLTYTVKSGGMAEKRTDEKVKLLKEKWSQ